MSTHSMDIQNTVKKCVITGKLSSFRNECPVFSLELDEFANYSKNYIQIGLWVKIVFWFSYHLFNALNCFDMFYEVYNLFAYRIFSETSPMILSFFRLLVGLTKNGSYFQTNIYFSIPDILNPSLSKKYALKLQDFRKCFFFLWKLLKTSFSNITFLNFSSIDELNV